MKTSVIKELLLRYQEGHPESRMEVDEVLKILNSENVTDQIFRRICTEHRQLMAGIKKEYEKEASHETGVTYAVIKEHSPDIKKRLSLAASNPYYRNWGNTVKSLPEKTSPLPIVDVSYVNEAKKKWKENVRGNEDILNTMLCHASEYSKTGKTVPILLVGPPGTGKTLAAKNYGNVMNLPFSFISGPSASGNRGLAGAPNLYVGAGAGAIAQSMITCKTGNPVICIDEIEKASGGYSGGMRFQDELLAALDDSNTHWHDNFIEMDLDASHIPYIFTANSLEGLSAPLLDRMEIIEMKALTKEEIYYITKDITVPKLLESYDKDTVLFKEREVKYLVELLWKSGNISCRPYQQAVKFLLSNAYLKTIETGSPACVSEENVRVAVTRCTRKLSPAQIGFGR